MNRPFWLRACALSSMVAVLGFLIYPRALPASDPPVPAIDLHVDISFRSLYKKQPFSQGSGQFRAADLLPAGVRGAVLSLYVPVYAEPHGRSRYQLEKSYAHVFSSILRTAPYSLPGCGIRRAGGEARSVSTWLSFEGAGVVGADRQEIARWALRGVRIFGLVHTTENALSGSSGAGANPHQGLTQEGKKFVREVFAVGGLVDVSHASRVATREAIALGKKWGHPIIATHSNAHALAPHPRNLTDEEIVGIARTGGIIGVNFHGTFLRTSPGRRATLDDVVNQMNYLKKLGGLSVVALGSDFEGDIAPPQELRDVGHLPRLSRALLASGWTRAEVEQAFYKNAERLLCARPASP